MIEKSDARAAYLPSLPTIPTPMSASIIIGTSLPPSPTDKVILFVYFFTNLTTVAFYVGEHLQHMTPSALLAVVIKNHSLVSTAN